MVGISPQFKVGQTDDRIGLTLEHSGIVMDFPPTLVPPENWTYGDNFEFSNGRPRRISGGAAAYGTLLFEPQFVMFTEVGDQGFYIYAGATGIGVTDGTTHFDITPVAGVGTPAVGAWTGSNLNGVPVLNHPDMHPVFWGGDTGVVCAPLPLFLDSGNARTQAIRPFKFFLVALNISDSGGLRNDALAWSDAADQGSVPATWVPAATNAAGDAILGDEPGVIVDGRSLRQDFIIYKDTSTYAMRYIGGQFVMATRKLLVTAGLLTKNGVVEVEGFHYVFSDDDIIRHDGQNIESIVTKKVRREIFSDMDNSGGTSAFTVAYFSKKQIWFCYPQSGETTPNKAAVYDWVDDTWAFRGLGDRTNHVARGGLLDVAVPETWDSDTEEWDLDLSPWSSSNVDLTRDYLTGAISTGTPGALVTYDVSPQFFGLNISAEIRRESLSLDGSIDVKLIKSLLPEIEGVSGEVVSFRIGTQQTIAQGVQWGPTYQFTIGDIDPVQTFAQGRFFSFMFFSNSLSPYTLERYFISYTKQGQF